MTAITFQDGRVVMRDGRVATGAGCCCDEPPECICPVGCVEGLQISLGNSPSCEGGFYSDSLPCTFGSISASMYCEGGSWFVSVSVSCFENGGACFYSYAAELPCENDGLPPAGNVNLIEIFAFDDGGCPALPPVVTVIK